MNRHVLRFLAPLLLLALAVQVSGCGADDETKRTSLDLAPATGGGERSVPDGCVVDAGSAVVRYRVRRGDTLTEIARRVYGDAALWPEIARANPEVVGSAGGVRAGDELIIPFEGR